MKIEVPKPTWDSLEGAVDANEVAPSIGETYNCMVLPIEDTNAAAQ